MRSLGGQRSALPSVMEGGETPDLFGAACLRRSAIGSTPRPVGVSHPGSIWHPEVLLHNACTML